MNALISFGIAVAAMAHIPAHNTAFDLPSPETLSAMCHADGGLDYRFGDTPDDGSFESDVQIELPEGEYGLFSYFELWTTSRSDKLMTIAYRLNTDGDQSAPIASAFEPMLIDLGWQRPDADYKALSLLDGPGSLWLKEIVTEDGPTELLLKIEGGLEVTSLYCNRADLVSAAMR